MNSKTQTLTQGQLQQKGTKIDTNEEWVENFFSHGAATSVRL